MLSNDEKIKDFNKKIQELNAQVEQVRKERDDYITSVYDNLPSNYLLIKRDEGDSIFHIKRVVRNHYDADRFEGIEMFLDGSMYDNHALFFLSENKYCFIGEDEYNETFNNIKLEK